MSHPVSDAMPTTLPFFRVATEGATADGRTLSRAWIEQMAKHYSPHTYGARVFLEHIRGIVPDSPFKAYGDVLALKAQAVEDGKLALFAQIEPTPELVALVKAQQKIYASIEVDPAFADTKEAYLVGLGITDSPASLGVERLSFATRQPSPRHCFSSAVAVDFDGGPTPEGSAVQPHAEADPSADARPVPPSLAVRRDEPGELLAHQQAQVNELTARLADLAAKQAADRAAFEALLQQLAQTAEGHPPRPCATGGSAAILTNC